MWQRKGDRLRMLCDLPAPFNDNFCCLQEWELDTQTNEHIVRIDFLNKLDLSPSVRVGGPAYYSKYRAALLGGYNYAVIKEIQRYEVVNRFFTEGEMHAILHEIGFYQSIPDDPLTITMDQLGDSPSVIVENRTVVDEDAPTAFVSLDSPSPSSPTLNETTSSGGIQP